MNSNPSIRDIRRSSDRILGGVCAGLARRLDVDPLVVRIGAVALTFIGPGIILLYLAAWALLPGESGIRKERGIRGRGRAILGIAALVFGTLQLVGDITGIISAGLSGLPGVGRMRHADFGTLEGLVIVVGLIFVGVAFLRRPTVTADPSPAPVQSTSVAESPTTPAPAPAPRARGQRSIVLFLLTAAATSLVTGVAILLTGSGAIDLEIGQIVASALLCVGVGLLVGTWWGRSRFLILIGAVLVPIALVATAIDAPLTGRFGSVSLYAEDLSQLQDIDVAAGAVTLDVTQIESGAREIDIKVGVGTIELALPKDAFVEVHASIGLGNATTFGYEDYGTDVELKQTYGDPSSDTHLTFNIEAGIADLRVYTLRMHREQPAKEEGTKNRPEKRRDKEKTR